MYRKTRLGPRTELQGISAVIEHSYWDFPSKTTRTILLLGNKEKRPNIWQEIPQDKFVLKTCVPDPIKSRFEKVSSGMRRSETILTTRREDHISKVFCRMVVFKHTSLPNFPNQRNRKWDFPLINLEHKIPSNICWKD